MSDNSDSELSFNYIHPVRYLDISSKIRSNCQYTAIDVTSSCLIVGTSDGMVFLYNRKNGLLQKLHCDINAQAITCITCLESVDLVIAIGTEMGFILVFQVIPTNNQMERYLINEVHKRPVRCLKWNQNGVKLFSGDDDGIVALTEMDYLKHQSTSSELFRESYPIVQIDYFKKMLLVSTKNRSFLSELGSSKIAQVGTKERKSLGNFGAHFYTSPQKCFSQETFIFASRPAFRLWKSNCEGKVLETVIFKDNLTPSCQILHVGRKYTAVSVLHSKPDLQFGLVQMYKERYLLTWSYSRLMILAIGEPSIVAKCDDFENIRSVALCGDEIYILDGFRRITRIASTPDITFIPDVNREEQLLPFKLPSLTLNIKSSLIKKFAPGMNDSSLNEEFNVNDCEKSMLSENCNFSSRLEAESSLKWDQMLIKENCLPLPDKICFAPEDIWAPLPETETSFSEEVDGIVFERKSTKKGREKETVELKVLMKEHQNDKKDYDVMSNRFAEEKIVKVETTEGTTPTTNENREDKEKLLAEMLKLYELAPSVNSEITITTTEVPANAEVENEMFSFNSTELDKLKKLQTTETIDSLQPSEPLSYEDIYQRSNPSFGSLSYGPPSGSSNITSFQSDSGSVSIQLPKADSIQEIDEQETSPLPVPSSFSNLEDHRENVLVNNEKFEGNVVNDNDTWVQHKPPGQIQSLAVCDTYMVCTDTKDVVYYSLFEGLGLEWHKTEYPAKQISISPSGKRVWRIFNHSAYALFEPSVRGPFGIRWMEVALDVQQISVHESCVWHVGCDGDLFCQTDLKLDQTFVTLVKVDCPSKIASVSCNLTAVLALTMEGEILWRTEISEENSSGKNWLPIKLDYGHIFAANLGNTVAMWIIDEAFDIWFLSNFNSKSKSVKNIFKWWQVKISDYIYQKATKFQNLTTALMDSLCTEQLTQMLGRMNMGNACLVCNETHGIWFYNPSDHKLLTNQRNIIGHRWNVVEHGKISKVKWKVFTASGVYHHHGGIWMWAKNEIDMVVLNPTLMSVSCVKLPQIEADDGILCLKAAPDAVWLLTKFGRIFIRKDITANNCIGSKWVELDLTQIANVKLVHVCCGSNLVWAVDNRGLILMRIGSLQVPSIRNFPPAWVIVDEDNNSSQQKIIFKKVYVGPLDFIVWAIDDKNNVYVREGIFPEILIGVGWVLVSGIHAVSLSISEHAVYALTPTKSIYRRYNISRNNYIGDYWKELPGKAMLISVTVDDKLWALGMDRQLIQHNICEVAGGCRVKSVTKNSGESSIDDDWEVV